MARIECSMIVGRSRESPSCQVFIYEKQFFRHFSAPERKHKTIKVMFRVSLSADATVVSPTLCHLIANRFQLLGEGNYQKKGISRQIIEHRTKSSEWTQAGKRPGGSLRKMCFQFTANDFHFFVLFNLLSVESISVFASASNRPSNR